MAFNLDAFVEKKIISIDAIPDFVQGTKLKKK